MDSTPTRAQTQPRDSARTRQRILDQARREFSQRGYAAVTVRRVAAAAGVSPNLITRYFGGKEGLFLASTEVRLNLEQLFDGPRESLGERLSGVMVNRWFGMVGEDPLMILLRAAGERAEAAEALATFLDTESLHPLTRQLQSFGLSAEDAQNRAAAVDVFVLGVSARMRVLRDDLGDEAHLRNWLADAIQRLIDAP